MCQIKLLSFIGTEKVCKFDHKPHAYARVESNNNTKSGSSDNNNDSNNDNNSNCLANKKVSKMGNFFTHTHTHTHTRRSSDSKKLRLGASQQDSKAFFFFLNVKFNISSIWHQRNYPISDTKDTLHENPGRLLRKDFCTEKKLFIKTTLTFHRANKSI
jgi:hypothetical protein